MKLFSRKKTSENQPAQEVGRCVDLFRTGINCTQAVLATYGPRFGMDRAAALKIAAAFGSGMGTGDTCGAVTGALMVLGLKHTKVGGAALLSKDRTEDAAAEFIAEFKKRNGTVICRELLCCDLGTAEGRKMAKQERHFKRRCPKYVQDAAEIIEEMLKE